MIGLPVINFIKLIFFILEIFLEIKRVGTGDLEPNLIIVGNKADLEANREVAVGEGYAKAVRLNAKFFEVAAVNGISNVLSYSYKLFCFKKYLG